MSNEGFPTVLSVCLSAQKFARSGDLGVIGSDNLALLFEVIRTNFFPLSVSADYVTSKCLTT